MRTRGTTGVGFESRAEVVDEPADLEALEHPEPLLDGWRHRGVDAIENPPCDKNRTLEHRVVQNRAGVLLAVSTTPVWVVSSDLSTSTAE